MNGFVTEYAIRTTHQPGQPERTREFGQRLADARAAYDQAVDFHGEPAVEFLTRQVRRTEWVSGKLPPKVDRDGGLCDPVLQLREIVTAGSIDSWQETQGV
ncbi:hypothetical protein DN069_26590 [Streptacidiphilus pinicola]|uniref:Uncharacterized protein n=1 Tax=Streptacidiphilus pinicola TaxID=2219663 RepID=A0A2X0ICJ0_9ACTN|nr:hypothetical protein [Streptacidiphilus pinicola]RAG82684.1 hypothetical protein DN069_26590 [Streptacidiphilus pinicola]